jgi:hypothetical protein
MKKRRFSGILAGLVLILLQPALLVGLGLKAVFHFFRILVDPQVARGDVLSTLARSLVVIGLIWIFFFGWHVYNELIDMEHFLQVAHGRLLVEMQRKEDVLSQCRKAVVRYAAMEEKIQDRLIVLHQLTKTHGPGAQIVKDEKWEIINLIRELDLLIERYPALKSKGPYVLLMETIQETGLKVITERINYNQWTYKYNVMRFFFPYNVVAWVFGFEGQPFLQGSLDYGALKET